MDTNKGLKFSRPLPSLFRKGPYWRKRRYFVVIVKFSFFLFQPPPLPYFGKKPNFTDFVNWGGPWCKSLSLCTIRQTEGKTKRRTYRQKEYWQKGGFDCAHTFFWWLFLLKIKMLEGPNFLTFPVYIWRPLLYTFGSSKLPNKGF